FICAFWASVRSRLRKNSPCIPRSPPPQPRPCPCPSCDCANAIEAATATAITAANAIVRTLFTLLIVTSLFVYLFRPFEVPTNLRLLRHCSTPDSCTKIVIHNHTFTRRESTHCERDASKDSGGGGMQKRLRIFLSPALLILCLTVSARASVASDRKLSDQSKATADLVGSVNKYKTTVEALIPIYE